MFVSLAFHLAAAAIRTARYGLDTMDGKSFCAGWLKAAHSLAAAALLTLICSISFAGDEASDLAALSKVQRDIKKNLSIIRTLKGEYLMEVTPKAVGVQEQGEDEIVESEGLSRSICRFAVDTQSSDMVFENLQLMEGAPIPAGDDVSLATVVLRQRSSMRDNRFYYCVDEPHREVARLDGPTQSGLGRLSLVIEPGSRGDSLLSSSLLCNPIGFYSANPRQPIAALIDLYIEHSEKRPIKIEKHGDTIILLDESGVMKMRYEFDSRSSGNLVRFEAVRNGLRYSFHEVKYQEQDGVLLPWEVKHENYNTDGTLARRRVFKARKMFVNLPLDDTTFGLSAFGLPDGSKVVNKVDQSEGRIVNGEVVSERDYIERVRNQNRLPSKLGFLPRGALVVANISILIVFFFYLRHRSKLGV